MLWIDAHGDLNTPETSPSGNVHGMPLAAAVGLANGRFASDAWTLPASTGNAWPRRPARDRPCERAQIRELGIRAYTMSDIDRIGIERLIRESPTHVAGPNFVHVSLDMDALDPEVAPGWAPRFGAGSPTARRTSRSSSWPSRALPVVEVVEVNPILDRENETASLAVELVASASGRRSSRSRWSRAPGREDVAVAGLEALEPGAGGLIDLGARRSSSDSSS